MLGDEYAEWATPLAASTVQRYDAEGLEGEAMEHDKWVLVIEFGEREQVRDAYMAHKDRGDRVAIGFRDGSRSLTEIIAYGASVVAAWNADERREMQP